VDAYRHAGMVAILLLAAGCGGQPASPPGPAADAAVHGWTGRWNGPEGTWLEIHETAGRYTVTIMNLDAARSFPATAASDALSFERDGVRETIRATDGATTGMKWLAEKSECLTVKSGEGYCRD